MAAGAAEKSQQSRSRLIDGTLSLLNFNHDLIGGRNLSSLVLVQL